MFLDMAKVKDLTGKQFGMLTVLNEEGRSKSGHCLWKCKCECGGFSIVRGNQLTKGITKSCGCKQRRKVIDGRSQKRIYHIWRGILRRCYYKGEHNYIRYGGRGITVCDEWKNNFWAFHDWAIAKGYDENAPFGECTLDRIDVNGNYEPSNCRWITIQEQQKNRTNTKKSKNYQKYIDK